jgi:4-hydroxybenzoate polyprenyltransferase
MSGARVADSTGNWVDTRAPAGWRPYLRLARADRPIGSWLLFIPCLWAAALAAIAAGQPYPDPLHIVLFAIGSVVMRGAGCTWNDFLDRDIDDKVERTRSRPIPAGQVTAKQALAFAIGLSLVGFLILVQFNAFTILTGIASLVLVAIYPLMKRVTYWPQVFLGLAFSWGALVGWAAVFGRLDPAALVLYAGSISWVIAYDTIYAHQDREDDALVGVKSTARLFEGHTQPALVLFYGLAVALIGLAFWLAGAGWPGYLGLAAFAIHLAWQVARLDINDPALCLRLFKSNRDAGLILFVGLCADAALRSLA